MRTPSPSPAAIALALLARGDWHAAHDAVQAHADPSSAWVHAHLHRAEGDLENAAYWYRRAGRPVERGDLAAELQAIAVALAVQAP
jgi:hypothetical protein